MKTPHKHAALIKAWADGAEIQGKSSLTTNQWIYLSTPSWEPHWEYRIKPEPKPDYSERFFVHRLGNVPIEIQVTFDGETNVPKAVQLA